MNKQKQFKLFRVVLTEGYTYAFDTSKASLWNHLQKYYGGDFPKKDIHPVTRKDIKWRSKNSKGLVPPEISTELFFLLPFSNIITGTKPAKKKKKKKGKNKSKGKPEPLLDEQQQDMVVDIRQQVLDAIELDPGLSPDEKLRTTGTFIDSSIKHIG